MMSSIRKIFGIREPAPPPPPAEIRIIQRQAFNVTLAEWRSSKSAVGDAQKAVANPVIQQMLDVIRREIIAKMTIDPDVTGESRVHRCDRAAGWSECLNAFESMALYEPEVPDIVATFAKENWDLPKNESE